MRTFRSAEERTRTIRELFPDGLGATAKSRISRACKEGSLALCNAGPCTQRTIPMSLIVGPFASGPVRFNSALLPLIPFEESEG
jgi:hypothetical protein